jgi:hypothetical protein
MSGCIPNSRSNSSTRELQIFYGRAFLRQQPFFRRIHWVVYQFELDQKGEEILR